MSALLSWDQQTLMPRRGAEGRARAVATLRVIRHRQLTDPRLGELLDEARAAGLDQHRAAMVRVLSHDRDRAVRLPDDLVRRLALAGSRGQAVWEAARAGGATGSGSGRAWRRWWRSSASRPTCSATTARPTTRCMDAYEPGMRTARVEPLFAALADELQTLLGAIAAAGPAPAAALRRADVPRRGAVGLHDAAPARHRLRPRRRPPGPLGAPVHDHDRPARHPPHDPDRRGRPVLGHLLDDARGRPRPVRPGLRPRLRGHADRRGARRSACTSRSRGCGRTSSAAACRSGSTTRR